MRRHAVAVLAVLATVGCSEGHPADEPPARGEIHYSLKTTCTQVTEDVSSLESAVREAKQGGELQLARRHHETVAKLHNFVAATMDPDSPKPLRDTTSSDAEAYCRNHPEGTLEDAREQARKKLRREAHICNPRSPDGGQVLRIEGPVIARTSPDGRTASGRLLLSTGLLQPGGTFKLAVRNTSGVTLDYGLFYEVERRVANGWEPTANSPRSVPFIGLGAFPGTTGSCFGVRLRKDTPPGRYRVAVPVYPGSGQGTLFRLWAPFTVE